MPIRFSPPLEKFWPPKNIYQMTQPSSQGETSPLKEFTMNMKATKPEQRSNTDHCATCRYYQEYEDLDPHDIENTEDYTGICRRYPPTVFPFVTPISVSPDVSAATGWCGEYTPKS